ncbi:PIG-L deacetylase family protein [Rhodothermus marinus]|uniref:LmbE family protein n=1 Tax=Rhodothermus marinus (strain ATCC 43812 / DSM 4252 / R-10) TaxID=518766 RepID=D0MD49_RHOM4|nr:PIG-L family deacetylase [Rhodothermus marinus]ACY48961.1 LmbE family protein [Rhodothermus marinus DSM 4252]
MVRYARWGLVALLFGAQVAWSQPEVPVEQWQGKTILLIGAHPDDDSYAHGTLARLAAQGNEVYVLLLTMGNVGTKDTTLSRTQLARIRKQEEINALAALGIPADHYINLGYDDGRLEYYATNHREELIRRVVYYIRKLKPDVLFAFDPGKGEQRWHKSDHRAASLLAVDAARAAEWPLLFESHLIYDGLEAHWIQEYLFFDNEPEDQNVCVDIHDYVERKVRAGTQYISQFSSAWYKYTETLSPEAFQEMEQRIRRRIRYQDGRAVECFRYYRGIPDGIGR